MAKQCFTAKCCAKVVLIPFNVIFAISGCALIAYGAWQLLDPLKGYAIQLVEIAGDIGDISLPSRSYTFIGLGLAIVIVGIVGCYGALEQTKGVLTTYSIAVFIVFCVGCDIVVVPVVYRDKLVSNLNTTLAVRKLKQSYDLDQQFTLAVDYLQYKLQCCGLKDHQDYNDSIWYRKLRTTVFDAGMIVPPTCCHLDERPENNKQEMPWVDPIPVDYARCQSPDPREYLASRHGDGCFKTFDHWFNHERTLFIVFWVGVSTLAVTSIIFSMCLYCDMGDDEDLSL